MNFQDGIPSIPIDSFKKHYALVFDLTPMQDATENVLYSELVGEPMELNFTFLLEPITELIVLRERMLSVGFDKFAVIVKCTEMDKFSLQQFFERFPIFKDRYRGSSLSHYVPTLNIDTFPLQTGNPVICRVSMG